MWVPDLGLALRVRPGMTQSSGADCSAPGISPCPLRGSRPTRGRLSVPRLVGIARHPTRAMRLAVLNPGRDTCFVTGCSAGDERVGGRWCLCGLCVRGWLGLGVDFSIFLKKFAMLANKKQFPEMYHANSLSRNFPSILARSREFT